MSEFVVRVFNEDYETKGYELMTLSNTYGCNELKDRGRVVFFSFNTRKQAMDFANEVFESYKISTKVIEWF